MSTVIPAGFIEVMTTHGSVAVRASHVVLVERDDNPTTCAMLLVTGHWTRTLESSAAVLAKIAEVTL